MKIEFYEFINHFSEPQGRQIQNNIYQILPSSSTDTYEINISLMISILHVICSTFGNYIGDNYK